MLQRATTVSIQILAALLLATVTVPSACANEYSGVRVHQKADSNIVLNITRAGKPVPNAKIVIERTIGSQDVVPVEEFTRTSDSQGVVHLNDLKPSDFYVICTLDESENKEEEEKDSAAWLDIEIIPGSASTFELKLPVPPAPLEIKPEGTLSVFRGVVVDPSGAVIPNVDIGITQTNYDPPLKLHSLTDSIGNFSLELPDGIYAVKFKSRGFKTVLWTVTVANHKTNAWKGVRVWMPSPGCGFSYFRCSVAEPKVEELK